MTPALNRLVSWLGIALALLLAVVSGLLFWAGSFATGQVHDQLAAQKITMPSGKAIEDPQIKPYLQEYAGQPMTTGDQAKAFADHYIAVHMQKMSGGRTYEDVSGEYMKLSKDPAADKAQLAQLGELRNTMFMGNSLRGMLLNAYAFGTMGKIATYAAWASAIGSLAMLVLAALGFSHGRKMDPEPRHGATASRA